MKRRHIIIAVIGILFLGLATYSPALAQSDFQLNVYRTNGYGNGDQIRGNFRLSIIGSGNISSVTYLIDGQVMADVTSQPFTFSFNTSQYPVGVHQLSATVKTTGGQSITTASRQFNFVSAAQESQGMGGILLPIFGVVGLLLVLVVGSQFVFFKKKTQQDVPLGSPRDYGISGGAVCPRCHRPFALNFLAINAGISSKFTRCPFCGKWSIVRRLSLDDLRAAEAAELAEAQPEKQLHVKSDTQKLTDMLDESRFTDKM